MTSHNPFSSCFWKKFDSPSSACITGDWTAFLKSIYSLLHVNKIFEVGISGSLQKKMKYLNLDIVQKAGSCISTDLAYVYELVSLSIGLNISLGYFVCTLLLTNKKAFSKFRDQEVLSLNLGLANDFNKMPENVSFFALLATHLHVCSKFCLCLSKGLLV